MDRLSSFVILQLMHLRVEVQGMHALRPLTIEDRANLPLEESQLPAIDRIGAVDGDRNFRRPPAPSQANRALPDMASVRSHPAMVGPGLANHTAGRNEVVPTRNHLLQVIDMDSAARQVITKVSANFTAGFLAIPDWFF
jgi:hypothetical protein